MCKNTDEGVAISKRYFQFQIFFITNYWNISRVFVHFFPRRAIEQAFWMVKFFPLFDCKIEELVYELMHVFVLFTKHFVYFWCYWVNEAFFPLHFSEKAYLKLGILKGKHIWKRMKRHLVDVRISLPYKDTRFLQVSSFNLCSYRTPSIT